MSRTLTANSATPSPTDCWRTLLKVPSAPTTILASTEVPSMNSTLTWSSICSSRRNFLSRWIALAGRKSAKVLRSSDHPILTGVRPYLLLVSVGSVILLVIVPVQYVLVTKTTLKTRESLYQIGHTQRYQCSDWFQIASSLHQE